MWILAMPKLPKAGRGVVAVGVSAGLVATSVTSAAAAVRAPVQAPAAAPTVVAAPAVVDPEPEFATKQTPLMAIGANGTTTVKARDTFMVVTLTKADVGEYTVGKKTYRIRGTQNLQDEWNDFGQDKRGALLGKTKRGKAIRMWVRWGPMKTTADGTLEVTAYPRSGKVDSLVRNKAKYPLYSAKKRVLKKGKLTTATIVAAADTSDKWHFTGYGQTGSVRQQGQSFYIDVNDVTAKLPGVQPNGKAALIRTSWLSQSFNEVMRKYGAKPRLVLAGETKDGQDVAEVFFPKSLVKKGSTLSIRATQGTKFGKKFLAAMSDIRKPSFLIDVATPGKVDSMVLVTGDSIASGEGASMGGTYLNGNLALDEKPTINKIQINKTVGAGRIQLKITASEDLTIPIPVTDETQIKRWKLFCETVDLACTSADVKNGKLLYKRDPGIVYEKGTWEKATLDRFGFSCHRSKTAPGTWLARYWKEVRGLPVRSINLACSGATTDAIIDKSYLGQRPQADQVKAIADWVPVTHVVNTIGANDIKFSTIARDCVFAPINSLLPVFLGTGGGSIVDLLFPTNGDPTPLVLLADDIKRDANGKVVSANPYFSPGITQQNGKPLQGELCSEKDGKLATEAIKSLPQKIAAVIQALHKAAPDAKIVNSNYPNEVPSSDNTYFPRQQWWDATRAIWLSGSDVEAGLLGLSGCLFGASCAIDFTSKPWTNLNGAPVTPGVAGKNPADKVVSCPSFTTAYTGFRSYLLCGGTLAVAPEVPACTGADLATAADTSLIVTSLPGGEKCRESADQKYPAFADPKFDSFFDAASDPANPAHATAQLIGQNLYSFTETMAGFGDAKFANVVPPPGTPIVAGKTISFNNKAQDSYRYAQWWLKFLTQGGILDVLGLGAIMYGLDQDWANETIIEGLNEAIDDGVQLADPKGEYTFVVDQTQSFNGREMGGKWVGSTEYPLFQVWGYDGTKNPGAWPAKKIPARGPAQSRAQFVNNFLVGQKLPIVCPNNAVLEGENGCIGSDQEAVHPNWLGQAAQGQCIVAVVTQAYGGGGNACVRSVGDGKGMLDGKGKLKGEQYTAQNIDGKTRDGTGALLWSSVSGTDRLCLKPLDPVREDAKRGDYTRCVGGFDSMPTWSDDWDKGRVQWEGKKLHWG